jgi:hypothetical protein
LTGLPAVWLFLNKGREESFPEYSEYRESFVLCATITGADPVAQVSFLGAKFVHRLMHLL